VNGLNALALVDSEPVSASAFTTAVAVMQTNYGVDYAPEKVALLFEMIREEGWSEERFKKTFKWFLKNKKFSDWKIADWFEHGVKVYPHSWYLDQVHKFGREVNKQIETYKVNGVVVYRYADGEELPFEKIG
jgi:hypothetical protein